MLRKWQRLFVLEIPTQTPIQSVSIGKLSSNPKLSNTVNKIETTPLQFLGPLLHNTRHNVNQLRQRGSNSQPTSAHQFQSNPCSFGGSKAITSFLACWASSKKTSLAWPQRWGYLTNAVDSSRRAMTFISCCLLAGIRLGEGKRDTCCHPGKGGQRQSAIIFYEVGWIEDGKVLMDIYHLRKRLAMSELKTRSWSSGDCWPTTAGEGFFYCLVPWWGCFPGWLQERHSFWGRNSRKEDWFLFPV